jgi:peptidoglycan/LPS O-acetylase OafA/YrhL
MIGLPGRSENLQALSAASYMSLKKDTKDFRLDINGLRAWAVMSVILYHFGVAGFSGGFVGVDIFFVISGYLMTNIIIGGLESASGLSIFSFYVARAKRIVPALAALCVILLVVGWIVLPAFEYSALSVQVISALGFFSNIKFWRETGYFSDTAQDQWLLHTWSLSVEWQFYLILPLFLWCVWKLRPGRGFAGVVMGVVFLASLALCVYLSPINQAASFYLLPTRTWEMLAGGFVYLLANKIALSTSWRKAVELIGFLFIISSIFIFDTDSNWPGWRSAVPVFGTALVLFSAQKNSYWTGTSLAQWLGKCSYSLYLWHWPIVVVLVYLELKGSVVATVVGLALTMILGWLSYIFVEDKARIGLGQFNTMTSAGVVALFTLFIAVSSLFIKLDSGVVGRVPDRIDSVYMEATDRNPRLVECFMVTNKPVPGCTYGGDKLGAIVIGDSHAASIMRAVEKALPSKNLHVLDWSLNACPTIKGIKSTKDGDHCGVFIDYALKQQEQFPADVPIIIMNRVSLYSEGPNEPGEEKEVVVPAYYYDKPYLSRTSEYKSAIRKGIVDTACALAKTRPVFMVRPIPEMGVSVPKTMGRALMQGKERDVFVPYSEYQQRNAFAWSAQDEAMERCGVKILDPTPYFCQDGKCEGAKDGLPIYYDDDHLSERGSNFLVPMFSEVFKNKALVSSDQVEK